jgi:hypothetical protein
MLTVELAKKREKPLSFSSGNTSSRGAAEHFRFREGIEMQHVPYRGMPQALTDVPESTRWSSGPNREYKLSGNSVRSTSISSSPIALPGDGGRQVANPAMRGLVMHARFEGPSVLFYASDNDDAEPKHRAGWRAILPSPPASRGDHQRFLGLGLRPDGFHVCLLRYKGGAASVAGSTERQLLARSGSSYANGISWSITNESRPARRS